MFKDHSRQFYAAF